jgi:hypothetical protein
MKAAGLTIRRYAFAIYALATVALGFAIEGLLIAPIVFCSQQFGFWLGMAVFTTIWFLVGIIVLLATLRFWPQKMQTAADELSIGPVRRRIGKVAHHSRPLGAIAVALYFGPIMGPPFFRALGYRGSGLIRWIATAALLFCPVWFTVYGGGIHLLLGFLHR